MTTINLGKIKPLHKGAYETAVTYRPLDFTTYLGNLYVCKATSTGNLPTNTNYFDQVVDLTAATGASQVGFQPAGTSAVATTVQEKLRQVVSVKDFGAVGDGVTDDTAAFSAAAKAAVAGSVDAQQYTNMACCDWAEVYIPPGKYLLTDEVDGGNKEIVWHTSMSTIITGVEFLNGRLNRNGSKISDFHHGILDTATSFSIVANRWIDEVAQVSGFTSPGNLTKGNGRDTVAAYIGNTLPQPLYSAGSVAGYSATGAVLSTPMSTRQLKKMRKGTIVQTKHAPQKYAGIVESWTASSITVKDGWYLVTGSSTSSPVTPTGTVGLDINIFRKVWALNANAFINAGSYGNSINSFELGMSNQKGEPTTRGGSIEALGMYVVNLNLGPNYYGDYAYAAVGKWTYGYSAWGGCSYAFQYDGTKVAEGDPLISLLYGVNKDNCSFYNIKPDGSVEAGLRGSGTAASVCIDFHSGASNADYDSRILATGGNGTSGGGTIEIAGAVASLTASTINLAASTSIEAYTTLRPSTDGSIGLGQAARRWSQVYSATGTINTSDAREKEDIATLNDAELRVATALKGLVKKFRFKDAVAAKGDGARTHVGVIAQEVVDAFASEGLDSTQYAILCHDEWPEQEEVIGEDGTVIQEYQPAGNRYGIRYEELLAFIISAL